MTKTLVLPGAIRGISNKKILVLGFVSLFMPFVFSYLCEGLINLSAWVSELGISAGGWLIDTPLFSPANLDLANNVAAAFAWPIERLVDLMLSPLGSAVGIGFFPLAAALGIILLVKTKGQSLAGLFVASMGLVFSYAFFFMA